MMPPTASITTAVNGGPQAAPAARRSLSPLERVVGRGSFQDLTLLVSELVTNSVRHGGVGSTERIELNVTVRADRVRVEIRDPRPPFAVPAKTDGMAADGKPGGWGLMLVDRLSKAWGTLDPCETDGRRHAGVWFELEREAAGTHAPVVLPG